MLPGSHGRMNRSNPVGDQCDIGVTRHIVFDTSQKPVFTIGNSPIDEVFTSYDTPKPVSLHHR